MKIWRILIQIIQIFNNCGWFSFFSQCNKNFKHPLSSSKLPSISNLDNLQDLITDTQVHSDLDPLEAPEWSLEVSLADTPDCLLSRHLDKHLQLCSDTRTVKMLLGELSDEDTSDTSEKVTSVLDKMSGTSIYFSRTLEFLNSYIYIHIKVLG